MDEKSMIAASELVETVEKYLKQGVSRSILCLKLAALKEALQQEQPEAVLTDDASFNKELKRFLSYTKNEKERGGVILPIIKHFYSLGINARKEHPEVDLEEYLEEYFDGWHVDEDLGLVKPSGWSCTVRDINDIARHFFRLGRNTREEISSDVTVRLFGGMRELIMDGDFVDSRSFEKGAEEEKRRMEDLSVPAMVHRDGPECWICVDGEDLPQDDGDPVRVIVLGDS